MPPPFIHLLPHINASLNAAAGVLITIGFFLIRRRMIRAHATVMISAASLSAVFLVGYLLHKFYAGEQSTREMQWIPMWLRIVYLAILFPHLLLAIVLLPLIGRVIYLAAKRDFVRHKRLARPTFAIWLYVSVTGVIIYWMLYHLFPAMRN